MPPTAAVVEPFRLVYSSSAGCQRERSFLSELSRRTTLLRPARRDEHAITLIVETFATSTGVRGELTVRKPNGELTQREVPGTDCHEVESAMALIAALMVDPLAGSPDRASPTPPSEPARRTSRLPAAARANWSLRIEARLTAHTAVAPQLAWGEAAGLVVTREGGRLHPSLGLSAQLARATATAASGSAELDWAAAQLTLCPVGLRPDPGWDFRGCALVQLGRLRGAGFETRSPATKAISWSSAGAQLEARYRLLGPLWLGGEAAATLPFTRERFYLEPQENLHRVPAVALSFGAGLGLRFF